MAETAATLRKTIKSLNKELSEKELEIQELSSELSQLASLVADPASGIMRIEQKLKEQKREKEAEQGEASARQEAAQKLASWRNTIADLEQKLARTQTNCAETERKLQEIEKQLADLQGEDGRILSESESRISNERREEIALQMRLSKLHEQKRSLETDLKKTFIFSFGKKNELKEQITKTEKEIAAAESEAAIIKQNIDSEMASREQQLNELKEKRTSCSQAADALKKAHREAEQNADYQRKLLEDRKAALPELEHALENFHEKYLVKTYGSLARPLSLEIAEKKKQLEVKQMIVDHDRGELSKAEAKLSELEKEKEHKPGKAAVVKTEKPAAASTAQKLNAKADTDLNEQLSAALAGAMNERKKPLQTAEKQQPEPDARKAGGIEQPEGNHTAANSDELSSQMSGTTTAPTKTTESSEKAAVKNRLPVKDAKLAERIDRAFDKLKQYYPEGRVFAFDSIDKTLRETMAELSAKAGYQSLEAMLNAYGFETITGSAVKDLRSKVIYEPGFEPDVIKGKIRSMLARLAEYYPDRVIPRGLQNDHKNLSQTVSGLYQWLGYENATIFLSAYGYQYNTSVAGGRPTNDVQAVIDELQKKYENKPKPKSIAVIKSENPELRGKLKTLTNEAKKLFGMSLLDYFKSIGLLPQDSAEKIAAAEKRKAANESMIKKEKILSALEERYPDGSRFITLDELRAANPDLTGWEYVTERVLKLNGLLYIEAFFRICKIQLMGEKTVVYSRMSGSKNKKRNLTAVYATLIRNGKTVCGRILSINVVERRDLPCEEADLVSLTGLYQTAPDMCWELIRSKTDHAASIANQITGAFTLSADGKTVTGYDWRKNDRYLPGRIAIPDGVERINDHVFNGVRFRALYINRELKELGEGNFCSAYDEVKEKNTAIVVAEGNTAFESDERGFYKLLPSGQKRLLICLDQGDVIRIAKNIVSIDEGAFSRCLNLKEIILPDTLCRLGGDPMNFDRDTETDGDSGGEWAGYYDKQKARSKEPVKITVDESNEHFFIDEESLYEVLEDGTFKLVTCSYTGRGRPLILEGTSVIGAYAFKHRKGFQTLELPVSVKAIGHDAFAETRLKPNQIPSLPHAQ